VRLGVASANGGQVQWLHLTDEKDMYIPRFGWVRDGIVWATVLNRAQNQLDLYFVDAASGKSRRVLSEKSDTWIETDDNFQILKSADRFIWPSWRDGHTHLYLYSFDKADPLAADAKLVSQITKGDFEVFDPSGIDESSGTLYVITNAGDARQRQLCSVKLDGTGFQVLTKGGTHQTTVAPKGQYYVDHFSALITPPQLSFCRIGGNCDVFWQSKSIDPYKLTPPQFVDFTAEDGTVLHGLIFLPPDSAGKKVPLLNNPYGGPHGQSVRDMWGGANFLFNQILMRDGIAILVVDNRGMGARGKKFAAALIHNFGDALTAVPLGIAFYLRSRRGERWAGLAVVLAIFISALVALGQTIERFIHPRALSHLWLLAAAGVIGFVGNEIAAQVRLRAGRRLKSPALIADGQHARVDGYVSLGVVASAAVVALGLHIADPIIGLLITLVILKITWDSWRTVSTTDPGELVELHEH